jgi:general secretion pathway protein D
VAGGTGFGLAAETGGMIVSLAEENFQATLRALATEGKVDVLSRPYILASDNQLASILVGQQVPFITNTRVTDTGQIINTVEYQDIGIILNVTPHINPDGKVIMDVAPEISSLLRDTTVRISDTVAAPVFSKRSAQSRVAIENGRTIVIGGLMEDRKNVTIRKVPVLGDIPVLGAAFRRTQESKSKTELLIFLTPHVAVEATDLEGMSRDEMEGVRITPHAVSPGTFEGHMDGMRRGATSGPVEPIYTPPAPPTERSEWLDED